MKRQGKALHTCLIAIEEVRTRQSSSTSPEFVAVDGIDQETGSKLTFTNYWSIWNAQGLKIDELEEGQTLRVFYRMTKGYKNFIVVCLPNSDDEAHFMALFNCLTDTDHESIRSMCGCGAASKDGIRIAVS